MTFTYQLPIANDVDRVRFYINDTDPDAPLFQDEEIAAFLEMNANPIAAAALAADAAAVRFRNLGSLSVGDVRVETTDIVASYEAMAATLRGHAGGGIPYAGGIEVTDVERQRDDSTRVSPAFPIPREPWSC